MPVAAMAARGVGFDADSWNRLADAAVGRREALAAEMNALVPNPACLPGMQGWNWESNTADVPAVLLRRATRVLAIAAAHGHRTLVLGAWGCGVFRNEPAVVAGAFADALRTVDRFDHVIFAVHDRVSGTPVHAAFAKVFGA